MPDCRYSAPHFSARTTTHSPAPTGRGSRGSRGGTDAMDDTVPLCNVACTAWFVAVRASLLPLFFTFPSSPSPSPSLPMTPSPPKPAFHFSRTNLLPPPPSFPRLAHRLFTKCVVASSFVSRVHIRAATQPPAGLFASRLSFCLFCTLSRSSVPSILSYPILPLLPDLLSSSWPVNKPSDIHS